MQGHSDVHATVSEEVLMKSQQCYEFVEHAAALANCESSGLLKWKVQEGQWLKMMLENWAGYWASAHEAWILISGQ